MMKKNVCLILAAAVFLQVTQVYAVNAGITPIVNAF
jgi:hypothetical protein